jgi:flagellar basal body-associated protein FliL
MAKLLPIILLVLGIAAGGGAGVLLKAPEEEECLDEACPKEEKAEHEDDGHAEESEPNYVRMKNQFVVPVVRDERVHSLVVLDLSLETEPGTEDLIHSREPKVRDAFLRVLFDHAHIGGFDGTFTESGRLSLLRVALLEAAQSVIGPSISDILITDIVRQEL